IGKSEPEVITALLSLLKDDQPGMRSRAAESLGSIGKTQPEVIVLAEKWLEEHQNIKYVGIGIDVLSNLVDSK
ncbi:MAG: HEAT repeat domain-containing protein, partial [Crocosphaera sp.]